MAVTSNAPINLRRKIWMIAGGAAVLLLFLSAFVGYYNLAALASSQDLEEQSFDARWSLVRIVSLLTDTETGQRGYILTGDESFLSPAAEAFREIPLELERLRKLLPRDNASQAQFEELQKLISAKIKVVQSNIRARREQGFENAERQVASRGGMAAMAAIRKQISQMDAQEVHRLKQHSDETDSAARRAQVIIVAANLLALLTAAFSVVQVWRGFQESARAKAEVERANQELEAHVDRRTAQLRRAFTRLEAENRQRKELEAQVLQISEREQRRISEDLHDGQGQLLAGALHLVTAHVHRLAGAGLPEAKEAENLKQLIREALDETRSVARGLYPVKEIPKGLSLALQDLASRTGRMFDIECRLTWEGPAELQDHTLATNLYRIAREAVNNAIKHGQAAKIAIHFKTAPDQIVLEIRDNGNGQPGACQNGTGLGMRMMRYRAEVMGGALAVESLPEGGLKIACSVPTLNSKLTKSV